MAGGWGRGQELEPQNSNPCVEGSSLLPRSHMLQF